MRWQAGFSPLQWWWLVESNRRRPNNTTNVELLELIAEPDDNEYGCDMIPANRDTQS